MFFTNGQIYEALLVEISFNKDALSITIIEQFNVCFCIWVFYLQIIKNQPSDRKPGLVCHPTHGTMEMF